MLLQGDNFGLLLGWVDFVLAVALSAWNGENLAELAEQLNTKVEHPNESQPNHATNQSCYPVQHLLKWKCYVCASHKIQSSLLVYKRNDLDELNMF